MRESIEPAEIDSNNADAGKARKRPRPGERRLQILQVLAEMLQNPKGERVTTAALAAKIDVSEASDTSIFAASAAVVTRSPFGFCNISASTCKICRRRSPGRGRLRALPASALLLSISAGSMDSRIFTYLSRTNHCAESLFGQDF